MSGSWTVRIGWRNWTTETRQAGFSVTFSEAQTRTSRHESLPSKIGRKTERNRDEAAIDDDFHGKSDSESKFLEQLAKRDDRKDLEEALTRKRRRHIGQASSQSVAGVFIKTETQQHESGNIALDGDEEFLEEMLNDSFEEELGLMSIQEKLEEDVNFLTDQLGYLSSSPK